MDEKIEQLAKELKLIKELQASNIYTANYQEAKALFSLGYRKESDTAREILEMIDHIPTNEVNELNHLRLLKNAIANLYGVN